MTLRGIRTGVAALCIALVGFAAGCTPGGDGGTAGQKRIVLLTNGNSPFWDAARQGLQEGAKELGIEEDGLAAIMEVNDGSPQGQIEKLRSFASQSDIVGVAVSALDAKNAAVAAEMKGLREKGVHVITVDADVDREKFRDSRSYYVGTDNETAGHELGIATKSLLEARGVESGGYVQFVGRTGAHNAIERMDGFQEAIGDAYVERDRMADDTDRSRAKENVRNAIQNHKDLVALVGIWSYNAPAIVDVVVEKDVRDEFTISVFDAEPIAIEGMHEGLIDVMVVQNPYEMGYQAVRVLHALWQKGQGGDAVEEGEKTLAEMFPNEEKAGGDLYDTGLKVVVPEGSPLEAGLFGEKTQFLPLPEFQNWLDEYDLAGS